MSALRLLAQEEVLAGEALFSKWVGRNIKFYFLGSFLVVGYVKIL